MKKYMILISGDFGGETINSNPIETYNIPPLQVKIFLDLFSENYSNDDGEYVSDGNYDEIDNIMKEKIEDYSNFKSSVLDFFNNVFGLKDNKLEELTDLMEMLVPIREDYGSLVSQNIRTSEILEFERVEYAYTLD